jgi:hypothetical protein
MEKLSYLKMINMLVVLVILLILAGIKYAEAAPQQAHHWVKGPIGDIYYSTVPNTSDQTMGYYEDSYPPQANGYVAIKHSRANPEDNDATYFYNYVDHSEHFYHDNDDEYSQYITKQDANDKDNASYIADEMDQKENYASFDHSENANTEMPVTAQKHAKSPLFLKE